MNITVELPITVYVDNVGAIWLSNNRNTGDRTKHIDIRTAFVKEYQEDGKIIIKFVKSEENDADIFTKNTSSIIYQKHQEKLVWDKKEVNDDQWQSKNQYMKTTGRMLKSKSYRTGRRTFRLRFRWECSFTYLDKPRSLERCK